MHLIEININTKEINFYVLKQQSLKNVIFSFFLKMDDSIICPELAAMVADAKRTGTFSYGMRGLTVS